jgi:hypothetical protein
MALTQWIQSSSITFWRHGHLTRISSALHADECLLHSSKNSMSQKKYCIKNNLNVIFEPSCTQREALSPNIDETHSNRMPWFSSMGQYQQQLFSGQVVYLNACAELWANRIVVTHDVRDLFITRKVCIQSEAVYLAFSKRAIT